MDKKIWLSPPHMGGKELSYVEEAFATNWIAPTGPHVNNFEEDIRRFLGCNMHVAALSSGTAALHLALVLLGIKAGDEVICQSMTFSASANPIVYQGAVPVFVDSESATWNMSPAFLESAIRDRLRHGKRPKAIIVVHLYGMPAQMDKIMEVARHYGIPVIEDAAEALGGRFADRPLGTFGDMGVFSFNGNKIITTSAGGALVSVNGEFIAKAKFLATQAQDPAPHYQHSTVGYNYRMSNICAGIGRGQMEVLEQRIRQRRSNFDFYREAFRDMPEITFQEEPARRYYSNRWLTAILLEGGYAVRERLRTAMATANIDSRPVWKPMHLQPVFMGALFFGDNTAGALFDKGLCLPSGSCLSEAESGRVAEQVRSVTGVFNHFTSVRNNSL
jgi:dTDP-4-amino-4,6-dideoxygalactose transaminase